VTSEPARILIVEDNDTLRRGIALALRERWEDVAEVASGTDAIERICDSQARSTSSSPTCGCLAAMEFRCFARRAIAIPARACW